MNREAAPLLSNGSVSHHEKPTMTHSFKAFITSSKFNLLLVFVPIALAFSFAGASSTLVFSLNFMAIMPLAKLLGFGKHLRARAGSHIQV